MSNVVMSTYIRFEQGASLSEFAGTGLSQIRWSVLVFSLFGIYKKEGLSKEPLFIKFRILEYPFPRMTHVTNLARMPQGETLRQEMSQLIAIKP